MTPVLSIITINFNNAAGLQKTMESVLSQSSDKFEYIVVDGGSTDGSVEVINRFIKTRNRQFKWISEQDNGIYHAMNKGIRAAKGEYCQFLNSGDWLAANNVIEIMLAGLPDCDIFYGNMLKQLPEGKIFRDVCEQGRITMLTLYKGSLNHAPVFIKRSLFDKYGLYDENLGIVSDWKWYLLVIGFKNSSVGYTNIDVACFDMNGISNTNPELEQFERRKVMEELLPARILADYDDNWRNIDQVNRIKKYKLPRLLFWFIERVLFKLEKWNILT